MTPAPSTATSVARDVARCLRTILRTLAAQPQLSVMPAPPWPELWTMSLPDAASVASRDDPDRYGRTPATHAPGAAGSKVKSGVGRLGAVGMLPSRQLVP